MSNSPYFSNKANKSIILLKDINIESLTLFKRVMLYEQNPNSNELNVPSYDRVTDL